MSDYQQKLLDQSTDSLWQNNIHEPKQIFMENHLLEVICLIQSIRSGLS